MAIRFEQVNEDTPFKSVFLFRTPEESRTYELPQSGSEISDFITVVIAITS